MDAFTGKEQNRANVVPMMCQFEMLMIVAAVVSRKANCNFLIFMVR